MIRGTAKFKILVWTADEQWEAVLDDELDSAMGLDCNVPTETFVLPIMRTEQFVRFLVKTVYGAGGGLQFIDFGYDPDAQVPCEHFSSLLLVKR